MFKNFVALTNTLNLLVMKTTVYLSLFIAFVLLVSCKKSDKKADMSPPVKKLKYITHSTMVQGNTTTFSDCTYDDKKRLSTVKAGDNTTTYNYNGNFLFSIETTNPTGYRKTTEHYYNDDGTLASTRDRIYRNNVLSSDNTFTYIIANGRITERHYEIFIDKFTYDNRGNPISIYSGQGGFTTESTYDDKPNVNINGAPNPNGLYFSPNNLISDGTITHTYTYDADGYPIGSVLVTPAGTTKYAYTYTEL